MTNEELAELIQKTDSKVYKTELWERNKGMIYRFARSYYSPNSPHTLEDLVQQGYFALLKAVKSYDRKKGYRFTSYLHFSFQCAIRSMSNDTWVSLDVPIGCNSEGEEKEISLVDTLVDNSSIEEINTALNLTVDQQALYNALGRIPERERNVVIDVYFHDETLTNIAKKLSVSMQRVSQLHNKALRRLRNDPELIELYADTIQNRQLKSLIRSADRPDNVESRHTLEMMERKQNAKYRNR